VINFFKKGIVMRDKKLINLVFFVFIGFVFSFAQNPIKPASKWKLNDNRTEKDSYIFYNPAIHSNFSQKQLQFTEEAPAFSAIIPDFKVNESNDNVWWHYSSSVASDANGNFVITWEDGRNSTSSPDIYAQRYDSNGIPIGENFKVNDDIGNIIQERPAIAMNGNGDFVIAWVDWRSQMTDIYAQRFASDGSALGSNFKVNNDVGNGPRERISVAIDGSGNFVITWQVHLINIYAQRFANDGIPLGNNFIVSQGGLPAIAMTVDGNFVITWVNFNVFPTFIYAQRYTSDGSVLGNNFKVNDDDGTSMYDDPDISIDNAGNFVITWTDYRNIGPDIYAQRFAYNGSILGSNFKVNNDSGNHSQFYPSIASNNNGNFIITWADHRIGSNIYAQRYTSNGGVLGSNFKVNDATIAPDLFPPTSIATDSSGNFFITWVEDRNDDWDIYAQRYASDGNTLGSNFKVNDDGNRGANQVSPSIAIENSGNIIITWGDYRHAEWDIYSQLIKSNGDTLGNNLKVNNSILNTNQNNPEIATDGSNNYVITWEDNRNEHWDIYAQYFSLNGNAIGDNFKVNDNIGNSNENYPAIAMNANGNILVTWEDSRNGNSDIYAQRYDDNGNSIGNNFKVNDNIGNTVENYPAVAMDSNGNYIITWEDSRNNNSDIFAQRYDSNGNTLGINFRVNDDDGNESQYAPAIAIDDTGTIIITWKDFRNGNIDIYAQLYDSNGSPIDSNFKVNDNVGNTNESRPAVAINSNGNFVIAWEDTRNGNEDIYAQRFNNYGTALGFNFRITNTSNGDQLHPKIMLWNNQIYSTWQDNRIVGTGYDIWANVLDWNNPVDEISDNLTQKPSAFVLCQNYPNPFNPRTTIEFSVPQSEFVVLKIYNLLGQEITTLVSEKLNAGNYKYSWDSSRHDGIASGIYMYQLQAGKYVRKKKMIFLK